MRNYVLNNKYLVPTNGGTGGMQEKFLRNDYWYKVDKTLGEGHSEHLVSLLLNHSTLPRDCYVWYEQCSINGKQGCRSRSFTKSNEVVFSLNSIYKYYKHGVLENDLYAIQDVVSRYNFLLNLINSVCFLDARVYLKTIFLLDMLIENTDRHLSNICMVYNTVLHRFRFAPIFDNGLSLGVGSGSSARTISGSFEQQVVACGYPIVSTFKIDYDAVYKNAELCGSLVLCRNLEKYKSIFKKG